MFNQKINKKIKSGLNTLLLHAANMNGAIPEDTMYYLLLCTQQLTFQLSDCAKPTAVCGRHT